MAYFTNAIFYVDYTPTDRLWTCMERTKERKREREEAQERKEGFPLPPSGGELNSQLGARPSSQNLPRGWLALWLSLSMHFFKEGGGMGAALSSQVSWGRVHNEKRVSHAMVGVKGIGLQKRIM